MQLELTLDQICGLCRNLSPITRRNLLMATSGRRQVTPQAFAEPTTAATALVLWAADLLLYEQVLDSEQLLLVFQFFVDDLIAHAARLEKIRQEESKIVPTISLGIIDRRFVTIAGSETFLDLTTGEPTGRRDTFLRSTLYNLSVLYLMNMERAHAKTQGAGTASES